MGGEPSGLSVISSTLASLLPGIRPCYFLCFSAAFQDFKDHGAKTLYCLGRVNLFQEPPDAWARWFDEAGKAIFDTIDIPSADPYRELLVCEVDAPSPIFRAESLN